MLTATLSLADSEPLSPLASGQLTLDYCGSLNLRKKRSSKGAIFCYAKKEMMMCDGYGFRPSFKLFVTPELLWVFL